MFTREFDTRVYVAAAVVLFSLVLGTAVGASVLWPSQREAGYSPEQPIAFSHKLHSDDLQIDCLYCHSQADKGPHATVPPVSTCMKCHEQVQTRDEKGELTEPMATLLEHWNEKKPIEWNKVNDVADFVYFDHSRHVNSGLECQECHGPVETMEHMRREFGLKMSWCLDCHKQTPPPDSAAAKRGDATRAPIHCYTCHR